MDAAIPPIPSGAGFGIRFLARFLDLVYGTMLGLVVGVAAGILFVVLAHYGKISPEWPELVRQNTFTGFGLNILGAFLYHAVAEGFSTVTIGKLICGLRVVQTDGGPATMKGGLIRDLGYHVDALFFGLVGYESMKKGPLRQRFGDVWGETVVVKKDVFQPNPTRGPGRMTAGILMGSSLWMGMTLLQLILKVT